MYKSRIAYEDEWSSDDEVLDSAFWGEKERGKGKTKPLYRPRLIYVFIFLVVYFLAGSIADFPSTFRLIEVYEKMGYADAIQRATSLVGNLKFVYAVSHFLTVPINALLTNHFGRKPFFALSLLAVALDKAAFIVIPPIPVLYVTKTVAGVFDSAWLVGLVSVADLVSAKNRAYGFSLLGVGMGMTFLGPPLLAGWVSDNYGYVKCIELGLIIYGVAFAILMAMPEPNRKPLSEPIKFADVNPFSSFKILGYNKTVMVLAFVQSTNIIASEGIATVFTSWLKWQWPDLSNVIYSSFSSASGVALLLSGPITKFVVPKVGEKIICSLGLPTVAVAYAGLGFIVYLAPLNHSWKIIYAFGFVRVLAFSVTNATLQSYSTQFFKPVDQVRLLSGLSAVKTGGTMIASLIFPVIFNYFIDASRGSQATGSPVFWIFGNIFVINSIILIPWFIFVKQSPSDEDELLLENNSLNSPTTGGRQVSLDRSIHHLSLFDRASKMPE
eukprot:TRINITY_DN2212_c0_g2_i1.p1 TRINITY_DN2212_c0_g2~~TRINITY_DN2212_c0_g2_i1.p1  ORF type:complete len:497 (+),score=112.07 TRINITY_DN2212_c0_g2_i1:90-1580(+)